MSRRVKRVLNFTGRRTIPHRSVVISEVKDAVPCALLIHANIADLEFPGDAHVILECYRGGAYNSTLMDLGRVADVEWPTRIECDGEAQEYYFDLKIVAAHLEDARLLGVAKGLKVSHRGDQVYRSMIGVRCVPLDSEAWTLDYQEGMPFLLLNSDIPNFKSSLRGNPLVRSLLLPEVTRQVLFRMVVVDRYRGGDDDGCRNEWMAWAVEHHPDRSLPPEDEGDAEAAVHWVNEVVQGLCRSMHVRDHLAAWVELGGSHER